MKLSKLMRSIAAVMASAMCLSAVPGQFGMTAAATEESYKVNVTTDGHGSASANPKTQIKGGKVILTATPDAGYEFDHWEVISNFDRTGETSSYSQSANVVFVLDSTGSMADEITDVKNNIKTMVSSLNKKGIDLKMSVIEYRDIYVDGNASTKYFTFSDGTNWTTSVDEIDKVLAAIKASGGGDSDETPSDAFGKLLLSDGSLNFPDEHNNNFLFLLTDAGYKDFKDTDEEHAKNHYSMQSWIDKFAANKVKVTAVTSKYHKNDYKDLYTKTGGNFIDITSDDYSDLMIEYSEFIAKASLPEVVKSASNPFIMNMPEYNVTAKAVFKTAAPVEVPSPVAAKTAHSVTVVTDGHGSVFVSKSSAYAGETVSVSARPADGNILDHIICTSGGAVLNGGSFTMPDADVVLKVVFKENVSEYTDSSHPYSYVFSYDPDMDLIETNSNRNFDNYPEYVSIKIDLGAEYAGKTGSICAGRKSDSKVIESVTLDDNGCYVFKAGVKKNYSFVLDD